MHRLGFACLLLLGCPERTRPAHGVALTYSKAEKAPLRATVDRRLAQLKLSAQLAEDDRTLTVRLPEGADVARVKALLARPANLEFCAEDAERAAAWCIAAWPGTFSLDRAGGSCALHAKDTSALRAGLADAGTAVAFGDATAFAIEPECLAPRVVGAEVKREPPSVLVEFDRATARSFATLTERIVGRRLLIRLDGEVLSAPVVMEAITGGKAMISTGAANAGELELLAASLAGGTLTGLALDREGTWGPPSLLP